jgi:hypothetical protein
MVASLLWVSSGFIFSSNEEYQLCSLTKNCLGGFGAARLRTSRSAVQTVVLLGLVVSQSTGRFPEIFFVSVFFAQAWCRKRPKPRHGQSLPVKFIPVSQFLKPSRHLRVNTGVSMSSSLTKVLAVGAVTALALVGAPGAFAADTTYDVSASVSEGTRAAAITANGSVASVASAAQATSVAIPLALTVDDTSGTRDGWNVTVKVSDFTYSGTNGGSTIPAGNFSVTPGSVQVPAAGTDLVVNVGGQGSPVTDLQLLSVQESVNGEFIQQVQGSLLIPADSYVGTYTGTLTTTISTAP